jgi:hypothetical protein
MKKIIKLFIGVIVVFSLLSCKKDSTVRDLEIIVKTRSGNTIDGAIVTVTKIGETQSSVNGKVLFENLEIGTYEITVEMVGYEMAKKDIPVRKENPITRSEIILEQSSNISAPNTLFFSSNLVQKTFALSLIGEKRLAWKVENNNKWFSVSPLQNILEANASDTLTVTIDKTLQQEKDTLGLFKIIFPEKGIIKTVYVHVAKGIPVMVVEPVILDFGELKSNLSIIINNVGTGLLEWSINNPIEWLKIDGPSSNSTQTNSVVKFTVDRTQMQLGTHNKSFEVKSKTGEVVPIIVNASKKEKPVITCSLGNITSNTALVLNTLTSNGGYVIEAKGVCYDPVNTNPNVENTVISAGSGDGNFNSVLNGLQPNTKYYVRAFVKYAETENAYSSSINFTTPATETCPIVTTTSVSAITHNSAFTGGQVISNGGFPIIEQGVCYKIWVDEDTIPAKISDLKKETPLSNNTFNLTLTQLLSDTRYRVRAYAMNSLGISYGQEITFSTISPSNDWLQLTNAGEQERHLGFAFSDGSNIYVGGGMSDHETRNDFLMYNPQTKILSTKAPLPKRLRGAIGFMINGVGYVGTGIDENSISSKKFWKYNSSINTWTEIDSLPGAARSSAVVFVIGTKAYIGSGSTTGGVFLNDFYEFDHTTESFNKTPIYLGVASNGRDGAVAFSINGKGYCGLGFNWQQYQNDFWEFDPNTKLWTQKILSNLPSARRWAVAFTIGNNAYIGLGMNGNNYYDGFYKFDGNTMASIKDFRGGQRTQAIGTATNTKGYVGTGRTNIIHKKDVWEYTPE